MIFGAVPYVSPPRAHAVDEPFEFPANFLLRRVGSTPDTAHNHCINREQMETSQ